jgi:hypothetical protein
MGGHVALNSKYCPIVDESAHRRLAWLNSHTFLPKEDSIYAIVATTVSFEGPWSLFPVRGGIPWPACFLA